ncbi:MAG: arginine--tRNA ligase [Candidatus Latescibacterota bacterium]|jgi:arginyl-tRNA synthetase
MHEYLISALKEALSSLGAIPDDLTIEFETPANPEHGDLATNVALRLAKPLRKPPRSIAEELATALREKPLDPRRIAEVEVAGPGFLNFRFANTWLYDELARVIELDEAFGQSTAFSGRTANVEFVSANPTGPLTVGHGRNAVLGDTLANLLEAVGYEVTREYYFNDAGRQMRVLGESVRARAQFKQDPTRPTKILELDDGATLTVPEGFPDDGYLGEYVEEIAAELVEEIDPEATQDLEFYSNYAEERLWSQIDSTLSRIGVKPQTRFNERTVYENESVWKIVDRLRAKDLAYDKDGAVWFRTSKFGKEKDTVLVKSSGEPTYRLPDIAYHADKLDRGYDLILDIFGADHVATYPDVVSGLEALGYDTSGIDVVIYQFVTFVRDGQPVKMSTRKATYVTLDELIDEVGADVARFFFLMRAPGTHLEFDLNLAKEEREKNPVYYLQYAHARVCSIVRKAEEVGFSFSKDSDLALLTHEAEIALIKSILEFPGRLERTAEAREPHRLINYLNEVATAFTGFYDRCRIIGEDPGLASARMKLADSARVVLRNGLSILGISAPTKM